MGEVKTWTNKMVELKNLQHQEWISNDIEPNWSDQKQDEIHFDLYLTLMEEQIVIFFINDVKGVCYQSKIALTHNNKNHGCTQALLNRTALRLM